MKNNELILLLSGILLLAVVFIILTPGSNRPLSFAPSHPEFQPGIWDQPVIRPPYNSTAGLFDYPFMYQYDLNASTGFASVYKKYYRPTYVLARGKNATIILNVTSYSKSPVNVTVTAIDNLPASGIGYLNPGSIVIKPGESRQFSLGIYALPNASLPDDPSLIEEGEQKIAVGPWLESEDWQIGQGFYLKMSR